MTEAGIEDRELIASAMFGYEGHRGCVNYLAVSPKHQREGHAGVLMRWGEEQLKARGINDKKMLPIW